MLLSHYSHGLIGFNKVSESSSAQILGRDGLIWLLWIQGEVNVDDLLGLEAALFDQSVVSVDLIDHLQVEWVVVAHLERVFLEDCLCVLPYGIKLIFTTTLSLRMESKMFLNSLWLNEQTNSSNRSE